MSYVYSAKLIRVVDGDTVDLAVSLGFSVWRHERFRLAGINAPERNSKEPAEKARAAEATAYLTAFLSSGPIRVESIKDRQEKYGRYLARLFVGELSATEELVRAGLASPYMVTP